MKRKEYPKLYYQFIKNDFGAVFSNPKRKNVKVRLLIDDMLLKGPDMDDFLKAIYHLNELKSFQKANIHINDGDVAEVNSKKHLPLYGLCSPRFYRTKARDASLRPMPCPGYL